MTTIKTTCLVCGDIDLNPTDLLLDLTGEPVYLFSHCRIGQQRPASERVVSILAACGVRSVTVDLLADEQARIEIADAINRIDLIVTVEDLFNL